jgi:hypothetical protein
MYLSPPSDISLADKVFDMAALFRIDFQNMGFVGTFRNSAVALKLPWLNQSNASRLDRGASADTFIGF